VNLDRPATTKSVNDALQGAGFHPDDLEFVKGEGYCYVCGLLTEDFDEQGLYGAPVAVRRLTTRQWLSRIVSKFELELGHMILEDRGDRPARIATLARLVGR
jgi:hypothetical protein